MLFTLYFCSILDGGSSSSSTADNSICTFNTNGFIKLQKGYTYFYDCGIASPFITFLPGSMIQGQSYSVFGSDLISFKVEFYDAGSETPKSPVRINTGPLAAYGIGTDHQGLLFSNDETPGGKLRVSITCESLAAGGNGNCDVSVNMSFKGTFRL